MMKKDGKIYHLCLFMIIQYAIDTADPSSMKDRITYEPSK